MSSDENEDPTGQFDAFRARQAEERAQQETQGAQVFGQETRMMAQPPLPPPPDGGYAFPQEYAAQPEEPVFYPTQPPRPPVNRMRSVLILSGAVLVVVVLGLGAWLAFGSSSSPAASASSTSTVSPSPAPTTTATATGKKAATAYRVTIVSLGADSFTGTLEATGQTVTVTLTAKTRYGTKAHPFSKTDLTTGQTVVVRGKRTGTDTITATQVTEPVRSTA